MSELRIAVDALLYSRQSAGIGHYIGELLRAYTQMFPDDFVLAVANPGVDIPASKTVRPLRELRQSRSRLIYEQVVLPRILHQARYDVVHFPDYQLPIFGRLPNTVITVHDLVAFRLPETFPTRVGRVKRHLMARSVKHANHIVVPSVATRDDLVHILGISPDQISVVPHGVARHHRHLGPSPFPYPYFLAVGTLEPRKNLTRLIEGFSLMRKELGKDSPQLVIAGKRGWLYEPIYRAPALHGVEDVVEFLDYVDEDRLLKLYSHAVALCYPSLYEGFGLPMAEAMMVGTPVVASNRGSLAEIGEGVAILVDPLDPVSICEGLMHVLKDPEDVAERVQRGRERADSLTWEKTAEMTRSVYVKVWQEGKHR